jgi:hypothetical protein
MIGQRSRRGTCIALCAAASLIVGGCSDDAGGDAVAGSAPPAAEVGGAVEVRPVVRGAVGACDGVGTTMVLDGRRCILLGDPLALGDWVADAVAEPRGDFGWVVRVDVPPQVFAATRDTFVAAGADRYVVVAAGTGLLEFSYQALAQDSAFGPLLSEREATAVAAALRGEPVPDLPPDSDAPAIAGDVWEAALGVHVCGRWLAPAPPTDDGQGVHSHGDGLIYVHPAAGEGAIDATLGGFLAGGGWSVSADALTVWDDVAVRAGDTCPDGRPGELHWTVDGTPGTGDPSAHRVGHREVIVVSFDPDGTVIDGPPPSIDALPVPVLGPDFG